mmetsp:Transcript_26308/g.61387  ORF Transcript_26308/g.61387 Transcript_26308/m.61387 type:complete len:464 (-) Transcript_26308:157-1548(-)
MDASALEKALSKEKAVGAAAAQRIAQLEQEVQHLQVSEREAREAAESSKKQALSASMQTEVYSLRAALEELHTTHQRGLSVAHTERDHALLDLERSRQELARVRREKSELEEEVAYYEDEEPVAWHALAHAATAQASEQGQLYATFGELRQVGAAGSSVGSNMHQPLTLRDVDAAQRPKPQRTARNALIFICDPNTEEECLSRRLLGLPKSQVSLLSKLSDTSRLFLFNVRTRQMMGVFQPEGVPGLDLEPQAWEGRFPVQVRFRMAPPHMQVLSLPEVALSDVLRYRSTSARFDLLIRGRALERLMQRFTQHGAPFQQQTFTAPIGSTPQHVWQQHQLSLQTQTQTQPLAALQTQPLPPQISHAQQQGAALHRAPIQGAMAGLAAPSAHPLLSAYQQVSAYEPMLAPAPDVSSALLEGTARIAAMAVASGPVPGAPFVSPARDGQRCHDTKLSDALDSISFQ